MLKESLHITVATSPVSWLIQSINVSSGSSVFREPKATRQLRKVVLCFALVRLRGSEHRQTLDYGQDAFVSIGGDARYFEGKLAKAVFEAVGDAERLDTRLAQRAFGMSRTDQRRSFLRDLLDPTSRSKRRFYYVKANIQRLRPDSIVFTIDGIMADDATLERFLTSHDPGTECRCDPNFPFERPLTPSPVEYWCEDGNAPIQRLFRKICLCAESQRATARALSDMFNDDPVRELLSPERLAADAQLNYDHGQYLSAYRCALVGAYLCRIMTNLDKSLLLCSLALVSLRPIGDVHRATKLLRSNVIPILTHDSQRKRIGPYARGNLAFEIGSFFREYNWLENASEWFIEIAEPLLCTAQGDDEKRLVQVRLHQHEGIIDIVNGDRRTADYRFKSALDLLPNRGFVRAKTNMQYWNIRDEHRRNGPLRALALIEALEGQFGVVDVAQVEDAMAGRCNYGPFAYAQMLQGKSDVLASVGDGRLGEYDAGIAELLHRTSIRPVLLLETEAVRRYQAATIGDPGARHIQQRKPADLRWFAKKANNVRDLLR